MTATRVAFTPIGGSQWTGGHSYLVNLLGAIESHESLRVHPVLFSGDDTEETYLLPFRRLGRVDVVRSPLLNADRSAARLTDALLSGVDHAAVGLFREHGIHVVFEAATFYGWRFPMPSIAWLSDFQHRRLKHQFSATAYWKRELGFRAQILSGRIIMLSSENARADCEHFYPASTGRTAVVRFAAQLDACLMEEDPGLTLEKYGLPAQFFYLPNQFWKHKNHAVVIEALGVLKQQGCDVVVAATGNPVEPRHPRHFAALSKRIDELGLRTNFRMLGMVPRAHVISLMRTCTALINPSLFEGWSSTVEEGRMLAVPMILSAIGVHREQMGEKATYFDPYEPRDLALKLKEMSTRTEASRAPRTIDPLSDGRVRRFACEFVEAVNRAQASSRFGPQRDDA